MEAPLAEERDPTFQHLRALFKAAKTGDAAQARRLFEEKAFSAFLEVRNLRQLTPLHVASRKGSAEVVMELLRAGANKDAASSASGETALHFASQSGCFEVVRLLLAAGANKDAVDHRGNTPLLAAVEFSSRMISFALGQPPSDGVHHDRVVSALLEAGADVEARDRDGQTVLHRAAQHFPPEAQLLLAAGADKNARDEHGSTPLHTAVLASSLEAVSALLEAGADVSAVDMRKNTPLYQAIYAGADVRRPISQQVIQALLAHGAQLEARNVYPKP